MKHARGRPSSWEATGGGAGQAQSKEPGPAEQTEDAGWWRKQRDQETQCSCFLLTFQFRLYSQEASLCRGWFSPLDFFELPLLDLQKLKAYLAFQLA